jgi:hypothetical protein
MGKMKIRDRVKELRRVRAGELLPNERNWRKHPKAQQEALQGVLAEIGYAGALLAYETPSGLKLIDGHLRATTTPDTEVPVLVLDVNDAEAAKLLATLDPLAAMAEADGNALDALLRDVQTGSQALADMLTTLADNNIPWLPPEEPKSEQEKEAEKEEYNNHDTERFLESKVKKFEFFCTMEEFETVKSDIEYARKKSKTENNSDAILWVLRRYHEDN